MNRFRHLLFSLLFLAACGDNGGTVNVTPETATADSAGGDTGPDIPALPDVLDVPSVPDTVDLFRFDVDSGPDSMQPGCQPGEGCFLDKCASNGDCQSGWCVEHMGDRVCTVGCQEECPPGWSCNQVAGTAPDLVYVCVSQFANLCKPCGTGDNCKSVGGADDVCLDYGDEGSFCGGACEADADCPWGFTCLETPTVDGIMLQQCVADSGVCPCTDASIQLGLWTPCTVENDFGACAGKRVCTADGLSACDAGEPMAETCNGLDDNCNGDVDEPLFADGKYVDLCDDSNECTQDVCNGEEGCDHVALDGTECKDGNPCTVADHCEQGVCVGTAVDCDDENPCTDDSCDETGGCVFQANTASCDDDDPCTVGDVCSDGECAGYDAACECVVDEDCAALEDDNLCNGTLVCDTAKLPWLCRVDEATVITCPEPEGPDSPCLTATCDPATGACGFAPTHDGWACEDGDACTVGDACQEGVCTPGPAANCNDGNSCTDDACDPDSGCTHANNESPCHDGDACTTDDVCAGGACLGTGTLACDDGNPCTDDACDASAGCTHAANQDPCDDGNACTVGDVCAAGACAAGKSLLACDDENPCTDDSCDADSGCLHVLNTVPCSDDNACTVGDQCALGECVPGEALACDDANACTTDACDPGKGCVFSPVDLPCDDGNACTVGDHCADGACVSGDGAECDDENPCTTDSCKPLLGCVYSFNAAPCDDGDVCTVGDHCALGICAPGDGALTCDDKNLCTQDSCDPEAGCVFAPTDGPCDDGTQCTVGDHCEAGTCVFDSLLQCDDANPCTQDACDVKLGCVATPKPGNCNDNNVCTLVDTCVEGACVGSGEPDCDDSNPCTDDSCDPNAGCIHTPNDLACDDGDSCTLDDQCSQGACQGQGELQCDDGDACTVDSCDPAVGCVTAPIVPCCGNGQVEAGEACDDGNNVDGDLCDSNCQWEGCPPPAQMLAGYCWVYGQNCSETHSQACARIGRTATADQVSLGWNASKAQQLASGWGNSLKTGCCANSMWCNGSQCRRDGTSDPYDNYGSCIDGLPPVYTCFVDH